MIIILLFEHSFQHPGILVNKYQCDSVCSEIVKYFKLPTRIVEILS